MEDALPKQKLFYTAAALALALAVPAAAQPIQYMDRSPMQGEAGSMPPREVVSILRSNGLRPLGQPTRRGPNYVMRAVDEDGREVRVVVDAIYGEIVSVRPTATASRMPPGGSIGPYEPVSPPRRYGMEAEPRGVYRSSPPAVYEGERPLHRPPAAVPLAPPQATQPGRYSSAPPSAPPNDARGPIDTQRLSEPRVVTAPEPGENGLLPPPPERFPQRAAPASEPKAKPAQPRRAASAAPARPPLPKPRPEAPAPEQAVPAPAQAAPAAPDADASPMPPPIPEASPGDPDSVPH